MTTTVEQLLARLGSGIESTPGVCGGDPRIAGTRIPVWTLEQYRRLGMTEAQIFASYPGLRAADLVNAWAYVAAHPGEIDRQIRENEEVWPLARLFADENFPLPAVEALRRLGHDVLTVVEAGQAGQGITDAAVLAFAHALGRAVLTHNRKHFRNLHNAGHVHSGLVLCTEDADFAALGARIDAALAGAGDPSGHNLKQA